MKGLDEKGDKSKLYPGLHGKMPQPMPPGPPQKGPKPGKPIK